jgi:hypothetical protein
MYMEHSPVDDLAPPPTPQSELMLLSLDTSTPQPAHVIRLECVLQNRATVFLIDSGSSHSDSS